jgi:hypothetical protein
MHHAGIVGYFHGAIDRIAAENMSLRSENANLKLSLSVAQTNVARLEREADMYKKKVGFISNAVWLLLPLPADTVGLCADGRIHNRVRQGILNHPAGGHQQCSV